MSKALRIGLPAVAVVVLLGGLFVALKHSGQEPKQIKPTAPEPAAPIMAPSRAQEPQQAKIERVEKVLFGKAESAPDPEPISEPEGREETGPANDDYEPVKKVVTVDFPNGIPDRIDPLDVVNATPEERKLHAEAVREYELALEEAREGTQVELEGMTIRGLRRLLQREIEIFGEERAKQMLDVQRKNGAALANAMTSAD